ncbi:uncharacterized protein LOC144119538 [Amblyomma americanum]
MSQRPTLHPRIPEWHVDAVGGGDRLGGRLQHLLRDPVAVVQESVAALGQCVEGHEDHVAEAVQPRHAVLLDPTAQHAHQRPAGEQLRAVDAHPVTLGSCCKAMQSWSEFARPERRTACR